jgi:hypothetical protein
MVVVLSVLVVVSAGTAAVLIVGDDALPPAPLPRDEQLRTSGFAVWPQDTLAEGLDACETPESWRLDPQETAFEFARKVLKYPDPELNTGAIRQSETKVRYLIGSQGVRGVGVFLGSVIDVKRYDRCWFVVNAEDREGAAFDKISFRHQSSDIWLVVHHRGLIETEIGYGGWERRLVPLASRGIPPAPPQPGAESSVRLPALDPDATGHIMSLTRNEQGIVIGVAARPLGFVPAS